MGFACGAGVIATVPPTVSRQSAPRLAGERRRTGRVCEPGTHAAPKPRSRAALLVSRCLLAEPLPLETSLPAPHLQAHTPSPPPFLCPAGSLANPPRPDPGSTSWASPGGAGVGGKCRGSVTAESGRSESGGGSPPGWGQGPQTTPWAEPTAEGSEGLGVLGHQSQLLPELPGVTHRPRSGGPHLSASISSRTAAGNPGNRCGLEKGLARWSSG